MKSLEKLNSEQRVAVESFDRNSMVFAGPGTGKTRVITSRIAYLLESAKLPKMKSILAITFTNKAANEMKSRVKDLGLDITRIRIGTFHNFCLWVLKSYGDKINLNRNFTFISTSQQLHLIRQVLNGSELRMKEYDFKNSISSMKNGSVDFGDYVSKTRTGAFGFHEAATEYQKQLYAYNLIDFDDAILHTTTLFKNKPRILELYNNAFPYVLIDEMQDTNRMQLELIRTIGQQAEHVIAVADDDQSIYGWRGAMPTVIKSYIELLNADTFILRQNYRSPQKILDLANRLIRNNNERTDKSLEGRPDEEGDEIDANQLETWRDEADWVTEKIKELHSEGLEYHQMIILYRNRHPSLKVFDELLIQKEIPFQHFGRNFNNKKTLMTEYIIVAMKLIADPTNSLLLASLLSSFEERFYEAVGGLGLYDKFDKQLSGVSLEKLSKMEAVDYIDRIVKETALCCISDKKSEPRAKIFEDLYEVLRIDTDIINMDESDAFEERRHIDLLKERIIKSNAKNLPDLLAEIDLQDDSNHIEMSTNKVGISTFHTAKGLEYKAVFIVALEDQFVPGRGGGKAKEEQEERRGLYVAITRSESKLYMTCAKYRPDWYNNMRSSSPSRYFEEMRKGK